MKLMRNSNDFRLRNRYLIVPNLCLDAETQNENRLENLNRKPIGINVLKCTFTNTNANIYSKVR